jgi:hypothetical protein
MVAGMPVGREAIVPVGEPFDGPAQPLRRPAHGDLFGIDVILDAEAAADFGRDHANVGRGNLQSLLRQLHLDHGAAAGRRVERVAALDGVILGGRAPRLERRHDDPVVDEIEPRHMRCAGEGGLDRGLVPRLPVERQVRRQVVPDPRRPRLKRLDRCRNARQHVIVDGDGRGAFACRQRRFRQHHGHRVADMARLVRADRQLGRVSDRLTLASLGRRRRLEETDAVGLHVAPGQDGNDAGNGLGGGANDTQDARMGMRRADEIGMKLARQVDVVDEASPAGQQRRILAPRQGGADSVGNGPCRLVLSRRRLAFHFVLHPFFGYHSS